MAHPEERGRHLASKWKELLPRSRGREKFNKERGEKGFVSLEYQGRPLAILVRLTTKKAEHVLWTWLPLVAMQQGNEMSAGQFIKEAKSYLDPAMLAFTLQEEYRIPADAEQIPMLQILPLPRIGEYGIVALGDVYHISQLPRAAQELQWQLGQKITELASPGAWPIHNEFHAMCARAIERQRIVDALYTQLLRDITRQENKQALELLEMAHKDVTATQTSWLKNGWELQWKKINHMMQELSQAYADYHTKMTIKPEAPPVNTPFTNGRGAVPSSLPFQAVIEGIQNAASGATRWQQQKGQPPCYPFLREGKEGKVNYFQAIIHYGQQEDTITIDDTAALALWDELKSMQELDTDTTAYIFALLIKMGGSGAWLNISEYLDKLGIQPKWTKDEHGKRRRAGHHIDDIERALKSIYRISRLSIKIEERRIPPKRKGGKERVYIHRGRVFTIDQSWTQEGYADKWDYKVEIPVALHIRAGDWLQEYLAAPRYVAYLAERILQYDTYREMWEKRLAFYFMFHARINAKHRSNTISRRVGLLFHDLSLPVDSRNPQRSRDRFEKAMNRLKTDKQIDDWDYKEQPKLPERNWFDQWQEWQVRVYTRAQLKAADNAVTDKA